MVSKVICAQSKLDGGV